jgi:hypothetical protein
MSLIEIHGLTKLFGPVRAVDDLSFEIQTGTIAGFLGPNGSGKTTTLRSLLGVATAFICRSQSAGLLIVLGLFPAEKILALLIGGDASYMPYGLLQSLLDQGEASPGLAAALLSVEVAVLVVAAWVMIGRRDVT